MFHQKPKFKEFISGVMLALPIVVGYFAIGLPFGIFAVKVGFPVWSIFLMSFFVFAGASQFVAVQLIAAGSGFWPIISAVFLLNLRHLLMGLSLGGHLPKIKLPLAAYLANSITDETFGVNISKTIGPKIIEPANMLGTNLTAHFSWALASTAGAYLGNVIQIVPKYTVGVLPVMFAVLLAMQLKNKKYFILAAASILLTILFVKILPGTWPFLVVALIVPTLATIYKIKRC